MNLKIKHIIIAGIPFLIGLIFTLYGVGVIRQQSFHAIDGKRYFCIADDGLITLRYGWNLAHGNGLAWNPGERIEGITNTLWALQAAGYSLFISKRLLPLAMQLSAIAWLLLTAYYFKKIACTILTKSKENPLTNFFCALAFIIPLSYSPLVIWGLRGMETSLQAALISMGVFLFFFFLGRPAVFGAFAIGLACAVRPDCIVPAAVIFGFRFLDVLSGNHKWKHLAAEIAPFAAVLIALVVFRMLYYGSPVPNTYILKIKGMSVFERITLNGIGYIKPFMIMSIPLIAAVSISLLIRPSREKLILAALPAAMLVYTVYVGGDAFDNWRFMAPYVPYAFLVLLLDLPALNTVLKKLFVNKPLNSGRRIMLSIIACMIIFSIARPPLLTGYIETLRNPARANICGINTAIWLNKILKPSACIGVFFAGAIPFYTDFYAFDFLGKSDRHIASLKPDISGAVSWNGQKSVPGHNKYDLNYSIMKKRPTYVETLSWARQDVSVKALEIYEPIAVDFLDWSLYGKNKILLKKNSPNVKWHKTPPQPREHQGLVQ